MSRGGQIERYNCDVGVVTVQESRERSRVWSRQLGRIHVRGLDGGW
jgi:hypothetical protein